MGDPNRIVVAGDWHGNTRWAVHVIEQAAKMLAGEPKPLILHCGDFGVWPGPTGDAYLDNVERACAEHEVSIWFVDGNHEDFTRIGYLDPWMSQYQNLTHLPRGWRWKWHGRTWLALGGAASVDRAIRTEGRNWWPDEEITEEQAAKVTAGGLADVMITHDCPSGVVHSFPAPPGFWDARDLARSDRHQERLQCIVNKIQPRWLLHGHLHRAYQRVTDFGYGPVEVTGLDADGDDANWAVLDVRQMTWGRCRPATSSG